MLVGVPQTEHVISSMFGQFSFSCLCFAGICFLPDLTSYLAGMGHQKYVLQVHCALNLVHGQLFCYVHLQLLAWNALGFGLSRFLFLLMCRESVTNYLHHVLSVKGCSSFMKRNQADIFFSSPYALQFSFLRNCLFDEFLFPNFPVLY